MTSGFLRRYEKFPGRGLEKERVRDLVGAGLGVGLDEGPTLENLRSEFLVKKRFGPELHGAAGLSGGSH